MENVTGVEALLNGNQGVRDHQLEDVEFQKFFMGPFQELLSFLVSHHLNMNVKNLTKVASEVKNTKRDILPLTLTLLTNRIQVLWLWKTPQFQTQAISRLPI